MNANLPRRTAEHVTGDQGVVIVQHSIPANWVYRDLEGKGDYGIDAEIEIFNEESPTGLLFRAQIRSHADLHWSVNGEHIESVKQSTRNYWRLQTTPVVLIACDTQLRKAYWAFADETETPSGVRILRRDMLADTSDSLRNGVKRRLDLLGPASLLLTAPLLERYWNEVGESTGRDSFLPIEEEVLVPLKMVYGQIPLLRYALALPPATLVPWDVWVGKSRLAFGDYHELYCAVFDEMIDYLRPVVSETLDEAARRLSDRDSTTGSVSVINWALRRLGSNMSRAYSHSFSADRRFWQDFDTHLESRRVRRFSAVDAYDQRQRARN